VTIFRGEIRLKVAVATALVSLLIVTSCGGTSDGANALDTQTNSQVMSLMPEYAPGQAILMHIEGVDSYAERSQGSEPLLKELLSMFPKVVIIDDALAQDYPSARAQIENLLIDSQAARAKLVVRKVSSSGNGGRFIRDWIGFALTDGKDFNIIDFRYFQGGDETAELLYQGLKLPIRASQKFFEGGNFTADSKGNCFLGEGGASPIRQAKFQEVDKELLALGCKTATYLPPMARNGDGLHVFVNHIDLWMRLLSDEVVAVATLDPDSLAAFKQSPIEFLAPILSVPPTQEDVDAVLNEFADLQSKLDVGAKILRQRGKTVLRIPHPVPVGGALEPFLNGVQTGKRLLLSSLPPSDQNIGARRPDVWRAINAKVLNVLDDAGFQAKFFDASPLVNGSGALHCATATLPAKLFE